MPVTINGNGTITGVSVGGLPDGIVDTDMLAANAVSSAKLASGAGGKILQVVQTTKTDISSIQSQTFTDVPGMSVTITPTSASNKILVMFSISVGTTSYGMINLVRGSTDIFKGTSNSNRIDCTVAAITQNNYECETYSHTFLDSPNTTSATTYKLTVALPHNPSYIMYVNSVSTDANDNYIATPVSSITVMEVAA